MKSRLKISIFQSFGHNSLCMVWYGSASLNLLFGKVQGINQDYITVATQNQCVSENENFFIGCIFMPKNLGNITR